MQNQPPANNEWLPERLQGYLNALLGPILTPAQAVPVHGLLDPAHGPQLPVNVPQLPVNVPQLPVNVDAVKATVEIATMTIRLLAGERTYSVAKLLAEADDGRLVIVNQRSRDPDRLVNDMRKIQGRFGKDSWLGFRSAYKGKQPNYFTVAAHQLQPDYTIPPEHIIANRNYNVLRLERTKGDVNDNGEYECKYTLFANEVLFQHEQDPSWEAIRQLVLESDREDIFIADPEYPPEMDYAPGSIVVRYKFKLAKPVTEVDQVSTLSATEVEAMSKPTTTVEASLAKFVQTFGKNSKSNVFNVQRKDVNHQIELNNEKFEVSLTDDLTMTVKWHIEKIGGEVAVVTNEEHMKSTKLVDWGGRFRQLQHEFRDSVKRFDQFKRSQNINPITEPKAHEKTGITDGKTLEPSRYTNVFYGIVLFCLLSGMWVVADVVGDFDHSVNPMDPEYVVQEFSGYCVSHDYDVGIPAMSEGSFASTTIGCLTWCFASDWNTACSYNTKLNTCSRFTSPHVHYGDGSDDVICYITREHGENDLNASETTFSDKQPEPRVSTPRSKSNLFQPTPSPTPSPTPILQTSVVPSIPAIPPSSHREETEPTSPTNEVAPTGVTIAEETITAPGLALKPTVVHHRDIGMRALLKPIHHLPKHGHFFDSRRRSSVLTIHRMSLKSLALSSKEKSGTRATTASPARTTTSNHYASLTSSTLSASLSFKISAQSSPSPTSSPPSVLCSTPMKFADAGSTDDSPLEVFHDLLNKFKTILWDSSATHENPTSISLVGTAGIGKSAMMTMFAQYLLKPDVWATCTHSFEPSALTKGVWGWALGASVTKSGRAILLIFSQGLNDIGDTSTEEGLQRLFALPMIVSNVAIFMQAPIFNDVMLSGLKVAMEFSNWASEAEETAVAPHMPTLVLVNREDDLEWVNKTLDGADGSREFPGLLESWLSRKHDKASRDRIRTVYPNCTAMALHTADAATRRYLDARFSKHELTHNTCDSEEDCGSASDALQPDPEFIAARDAVFKRVYELAVVAAQNQSTTITNGDEWVTWWIGVTAMLNKREIKFLDLQEQMVSARVNKALHECNDTLYGVIDDLLTKHSTTYPLEPSISEAVRACGREHGACIVPLVNLTPTINTELYNDALEIVLNDIEQEAMRLDKRSQSEAELHKLQQQTNERRSKLKTSATGLSQFVTRTANATTVTWVGPVVTLSDSDIDPTKDFVVKAREIDITALHNAELPGRRVVIEADDLRVPTNNVVISVSGEHGVSYINSPAAGVGVLAKSGGEGQSAGSIQLHVRNVVGEGVELRACGGHGGTGQAGTVGQLGANGQSFGVAGNSGGSGGGGGSGGKGGDAGAITIITSATGSSTLVEAVHQQGAGGAGGLGGLGGHGGVGGPLKTGALCETQFIFTRCTFYVEDPQGANGQPGPHGSSGDDGANGVSVDTPQKLPLMHASQTVMQRNLEYGEWLFLNGQVEQATEQFAWVYLQTSATDMDTPPLSTPTTATNLHPDATPTMHLHSRSLMLLERASRGQDMFGHHEGYTTLMSSNALFTWVDTLKTMASAVETTSKQLRSGVISHTSRIEAANTVIQQTSQLEAHCIQQQDQIRKSAASTFAELIATSKEVHVLSNTASEQASKLSEAATRAEADQLTRQSKKRWLQSLLNVATTVIPSIVVGVTPLTSALSIGAHGKKALAGVQQVVNKQVGKLSDVGAQLVSTLDKSKDVFINPSTTFGEQHGRVKATITEWKSVFGKIKAIPKASAEELEQVVSKFTKALNNSTMGLVSATNSERHATYTAVTSELDSLRHLTESRDYEATFTNLNQQTTALNQLVVRYASEVAEEDSLRSQLESTQVLRDQAASVQADNRDDHLVTQDELLANMWSVLRAEFVHVLYLKHKALQYETLRFDNAFHVPDLTTTEHIALADVEMELQIQKGRALIRRAAQHFACRDTPLLFSSDSDMVRDLNNKAVATFDIAASLRVFRGMSHVMAMRVAVTLHTVGQTKGQPTHVRAKLTHLGSLVTVVDTSRRPHEFSHDPRSTLVRANITDWNQEDEASTSTTWIENQFAHMSGGGGDAELGDGEGVFASLSPFTQWTLELIDGSTAINTRIGAVTMCFSGTFQPLVA